MKYLTRTIWTLSFISLFTDIASEMLYPIMPIYLRSIGFSVLLIGILEGIAEATAGLSKGYFGKISDHSGRRAPFIRFGYTNAFLADGHYIRHCASLFFTIHYGKDFKNQ